LAVALNSAPALAATLASAATVAATTITVTKLVSIDGGVTLNSVSSAPPGTVLTYKIIATNSGATAATSVQFQDVLPPFLTYKPGSGKTATAAGTLYGSATALTEGAGGYSFSASTVNFNPIGPGATVAGNGGVLVLFFQATVN